MRSRPASNDRSANRAEAARQRRTDRSQQRVSMVSNRITNPANPRPVIVRGNTFGTPIHRKAGTQRARRQFYLSMDQAGTELRLPAIRLANPGWRLLSALIAILAAVGIYSMWNSPFFSILAVEVSGLQRLSPEDLSGVLYLDNRSIVEVDRQAALETLQQEFPELADVKVGVFMPNIVTVTATERQPVLAWQKGDDVQWVDSEGVIFPTRGDAGAVVTVHSETDLPRAVPPIVDPLAAGQEEADAAQAEEAESAGLLASLFAVKEDPAGQPASLSIADPTVMAAALALSQQLPPEIAIVYNPTHGLGWNDPQGWQVYIGKDLTEFEAKYAAYQTIASHLNEQGLWPSLVSVEHLNAPFYRLEQ